MVVAYYNTYKLKPGTAEQFAKEINESGCQAMFRSMPGNIYFDFMIPVKDADVLVMADCWADEKSFEAHLDCPAVHIWHAVKDKYVIDKDCKRFEVEKIL